MNELSLFSGAGGGLLGTKLLGWRAIGYVEFSDYCQRVIAQRIEDGYLDRAPVFGNIETFLSEGYAEQYRGMVDVITAGFPCQPFSVAGKGEGENDPRNKWPETIECLRVVRPRLALLENVPGLFAHEYTREIFRELAEAGFDAQWCVLGAGDCGAPHRRKRVWIKAKLCDTDSESQSAFTLNAKASGVQDVANASGGRCGRAQGGEIQQPGRTEIIGRGSDVPHATSERRGEAGPDSERPAQRAACSGNALADADSQRLQREQRGQPNKEEREKPQERPARPQGFFSGGAWPAEPELGRVANGVADRMDRLKALGNGQVPRVAATAWRMLSE